MGYDIYRRKSRNLSAVVGGGGGGSTPLSESIVIGVKKCLLNSMYVSKKGTDSGLKGHISFDKILFQGVGVDF